MVHTLGETFIKLSLLVFCRYLLVASVVFAIPKALAVTCVPDGAGDSLASLTHYSSGWGIDHRNTRYQPHSVLSSQNADRLALKWVYALGGNAPRSYPLITQDMIYVGSDGEGLLALDRESGCERWRFRQSFPWDIEIPGRDPLQRSYSKSECADLVGAASSH